MPQTPGGALEFPDWACKYNQRQTGDAPISKKTGQLKGRETFLMREQKEKQKILYIIQMKPSVSFLILTEGKFFIQKPYLFIKGKHVLSFCHKALNFN